MRQRRFQRVRRRGVRSVTATGSGGTRTAFAGNAIPAGRINPVAAAYAALYPLPNRPGTVAQLLHQPAPPVRLQRRAWAASITTSTRPNRLFVTGYWNKRAGGPLQLGAGRRQRDRRRRASTASSSRKGFDYRSNVGVTGGYTSALSSRAAVRRAHRAGRGSANARDPAQEFDPATLGFVAAGAAADAAATTTCRSSPSAASARPTRTRRSRRSARSGPTGATASAGRWTRSR